MAVWHGRSKRKKTGGRNRRLRKPRKHEQGSEFSAPELGDQRLEEKESRGGSSKQVVRRTEHVNLASDGEVKRVKIQSVEKNPADPNYVRRSLLTKGTIIETSEGRAEVTSRPGQEGVVNAKLLE